MPKHTPFRRVPLRFYKNSLTYFLEPKLIAPKTAQLLSNTTLKMKNQTPLVTVPSRSLGMKALPKILLALTAVAALSVAYPAKASYIVTLEQVGSDVVANGSGTIDLTDLIFSFTFPGVSPSQINGFNAVILTGQNGVTNAYTGFTGPTSFGSINVNFTVDSGIGDLVGISAAFGIIELPLGYMSGNALSDNATYTGTTFASLGVTPGTYEWTWGTGDHADSFTLQIGAVPDRGSTLSLLGFASLGLVALRRKLSC